MKYVIDGKRTQVYTTHQGQRGSDGKDGSSIESVEFVGQSELGNTYRMTFSDGHSYDFTAPKGNKGEDGRDGKDGLQGERGLQGVKGDRGEQGIQGIQGIQGERGFTGEKGEKGDKGENAIGYFQMYVDGSGNLILQHYEGDKAPEFRYDASTGILYMIG